MTKLFTSLILITLFASCSSIMTKLTSDGKEVKVVDKRPKNCQPVGKVEGLNNDGSEDLAIVHARNLAGKEDADTLYIDDTIEQGKRRRVLATAFICNE
ncbi:putative lipoprotein [Bacteriovorax sp. BSW11_IV]|uniref:lipoprotein n=1 Tax=Bacteriovorax sp. BSW11_IV TaxID=1353529 RepID=UPI00038A537F|nr:lipoprotein [Bacteriovorax sp. BSW11_IV]EQC44477.1 putative lipoprotein [Bacteriovorax sp. BSW11_IV]